MTGPNPANSKQGGGGKKEKISDNLWQNFRQLSANNRIIFHGTIGLSFNLLFESRNFYVDVKTVNFSKATMNKHLWKGMRPVIIFFYVKSHLKKFVIREIS